MLVENRRCSGSVTTVIFITKRVIQLIMKVPASLNAPAFLYQAPGEGMTLHDYGYLPAGFLKSYPVSERNFQIYTLPRSLAFFRGFFGESIVMQISFVMLIFLLFSIVF